MNTEPSYVEVAEGRRLAYQEYGDPDGHPVFFFHGWLGSRLDFAPNDTVARDHSARVLAVDRPGCGESDFQPNRTLLDWPSDVAKAADELGFEQFAVCGHSFGGPYVAACAFQLGDRLTSAAIVAGISPLSFDGATAGMPGLVRSVLWLGGTAPALLRPYAALMGSMASKPGAIEKAMGSQLPEQEQGLLSTPRFDGFFDNLGEMTKHGSTGAYWDARAFLGDWGFACSDIQTPVGLFYGTEDRNVPIQMGEYYRDQIPNSAATFYEGEGHFIMYTRASEILTSLSAEV